MIIKTADASAAGERRCGVVTLTLTEEPDGWTYRVEDMHDKHFTLAWRAKSPESATRKLQDAYRGDAWQLTIRETG